MKRANSPTSISDRAPKKNWLSTAIPPPRNMVVSAAIRDRDSLFIAHAAPCSTASAAHSFRAYIRQTLFPSLPQRAADHSILCYRVISLKIGRTGELESDFRVECEKDDDSESGAGAAMREVFIESASVDFVVVVSRWFGGVLLGPVRFDHIKNCTRDVLAQLNTLAALKELSTKLKMLDAEIESYLSTTRDGSKVAATERDYGSEVGMTEIKARRLVTAREKRLELLRNQAIADLVKEVESDEQETEAAGASDDVVEEAPEISRA